MIKLLLIIAENGRIDWCRLAYAAYTLRSGIDGNHETTELATWEIRWEAVDDNDGDELFRAMAAEREGRHFSLMMQ